MNSLQITCCIIAVFAFIDIWVTSINTFHYRHSSKLYTFISIILSILMCIGWSISFYYQRYFFRILMSIIYFLLTCTRISSFYDIIKKEKISEQDYNIEIIDVPFTEMPDEEHTKLIESQK